MSVIKKPAEVHYKTQHINFVAAEDYPSELPQGLADYICEKYNDKDKKNPYEGVFDNKISGYPRWIQEAESLEEYEFILQIDSDCQPYWDWGDCSSLYLFRHHKTGEFYATVQMS